MPRNRTLAFGLLISFSTAFILWLSYARVFERYELQTFDWRFQLRGSRPARPDIVHIDIWNDSLKSIGTWPFDRRYHAQLIHNLHECGAKAVVFDILFSEPHPSDPWVEREVKESGNVYFAFSFSGIRSTFKKYVADRIESDVLPSYKKAAKAAGFVNAKVDLDGKRRRVMPVITHRPKDGKPTDYYQLSFQVLFDLLGIDRSNIRLQSGKYLELSPDFRIPLDEENCLIINFAGPWESTFPHYSYLDILSSYESIAAGEKPVIDLKKLKDKICIIGMTAQGSVDISPVTVQSVYPMVGTYSNILNTALQKDFIRRLDRKTNLLILIFVAFCAALLSFYKKPAISVMYTLAALTVFMAGVINLFIYTGIWADLFYPSAVMVFVYAVVTLARIMREMHKRELIENELKIASQIQQSFLPATVPVQKGLGLACFMKPAKAVGGDLYAFMPLGEERLGVMIGDVSGKGTPAALFMAKVVSEFKFSARQSDDPAQVLSKLNDSIASEATGGLFVTLCYAIFDMKKMRMSFSNAGHLPLIVANAQGTSEQIMTDGGMPIGVIEGTAFSTYERALKAGERYAFYTDGITEARNKRKEELGTAPVEKTLILQTQGAEKVLEEVLRQVTHFIGKAEQHDDMTLLIAQIGTPSGP